MAYEQLKKYAKAAVDGDEEALEMVVLCAPAGTLGDKDPMGYAESILSGDVDLDEDDCKPMSVDYSEGEIPWPVEDDVRVFKKYQAIMGSPERYAKVKAALDKESRDTAKAKEMLAGEKPEGMSDGEE